MRLAMKHAFIVALLSFWVAAHAIDTQPAFEDRALQIRYERLVHELRCPLCQNNTVADSPGGISADLRREVREQIAAGKSDAEILEFMTARYGDFILYKPPVKATTLLLWGAPVILLVIGITAAGLVIVRRSRVPIDDNGHDDAHDDASTEARNA